MLQHRWTRSRDTFGNECVTSPLESASTFAYRCAVLFVLPPFVLTPRTARDLTGVEFFLLLQRSTWKFRSNRAKFQIRCNESEIKVATTHRRFFSDESIIKRLIIKLSLKSNG